MCSGNPFYRVNLKFHIVNVYGQKCSKACGFNLNVNTIHVLSWRRVAPSSLKSDVYRFHEVGAIKQNPEDFLSPKTDTICLKCTDKSRYIYITTIPLTHSQLGYDHPL